MLIILSITYTQSLTHVYRDDDKILVLVLELLVSILFCTAVSYPALCFQFPIKVLIFGSKQPNMPLSDILRQIFALAAQLGILTLANSLRRAGHTAPKGSILKKNISVSFQSLRGSIIPAGQN